MKPLICRLWGHNFGLPLPAIAFRREIRCKRCGWSTALVGFDRSACGWTESEDWA